MTETSIPERRKHLYVGILVVLTTLLLVVYKPGFSGKSPEGSRAAEANKLANTLFQ